MDNALYHIPLLFSLVIAPFVTGPLVGTSGSIQVEHDLDIALPASVEPLSEEAIMAKYRGANRPDMVYGNANATVTIGISIKEVEFTDDQIYEFISNTKEGLKKQIAVEWLSDKKETINGIKIGVMRFWSSAPDERIYNMLCVTSMDGQLVMITFNAVESLHAEWDAEFEEAKNSIAFVPAE